MGILDALRGSPKAALSPKTAMLLACVSMMGADGEISDDEVNIVRRIDGGEPSDEWDLALRTWEKMSGPRECIELVSGCLDVPQRQYTFANLIDIALADGGLGDAEQQLIEGYMIAFDLEVEFVDAALKVLVTKNDRAPFQP